jgi:hypothetical protein
MMFLHEMRFRPAQEHKRNTMEGMLAAVACADGSLPADS